MSKKILFTVAVVLLMLLAVAGTIIYLNMPNTEEADPEAFYGVSGDTSAVFLNNEAIDIRGIKENEEFYLPLSYIKEQFNKGFYEDSETKSVLYTLEDRTWCMTPEETGMKVWGPTKENGSQNETLTEDYGGIPVITVHDEYYLSVEILVRTTALQVETFSDPNRIYLESLPETVEKLTLENEVILRTDATIKAPVLEKMTAGETLEKIGETGDWLEVKSEKGNLGFLEKEDIEKMEFKTESIEVKNIKSQDFTKVTIEGSIVLGFDYIDDISYGYTGLEDHLRDRSEVTVFCPTWFVLEGEAGDFRSCGDSAYVALAHENGKAVWAMLENISGDCDEESLFSSESARKNLIKNLLAKVEELNLDGLNMDIESLKAETVPDYIQFLKELKQALSGTGVLLSIDTYAPFSWNEKYDLPSLSSVADYVIIMGYDESYSEAGPCASLPFAKNCVEKALVSVSPDRLIMGIPFYTKAFTKTDSGVSRLELSMKKCEELKTSCENLQFLDDKGCFYGTCEIDTKTYEIWFEDERSTALRLELYSSYSIKGIAAWRLYQDIPEVWPLIGSYFSD